MAINNIKITTHDIFIEKDKDNKGGNLTVGGTTNTNRLIVTGNTINDGNLTVYGDISLSGSSIKTISSGNGLKLSSLGITIDGGLGVGVVSSTATSVNSPAVSVSTTTLTVTGNTINNGNLTVGATNATTNLTVHGSTTTDSLTVNAINVTGANKTLTLSVDANSKLNISGSVNVEGAITSTTNISMSNINATGDLTVNGTTNTNILNVNAINVAENGNLIIGNNGSLTIGGNSVIHTGNIGLQSVSRADTAGSADSVAWGNVKDKPDIATPSAAGLVKSSTTGTTSDRDYNVEVNSDGTMKVNVPWTDTTYTNGTGLSLSGGEFSVNIQDNLDSDSSTDVLSAKQGKELKSQIDTKVTIDTDQTITGYKKLFSIGIDTINGATLGNAIMRQDTLTGEVILGSVNQPLRLWGNGDRPTYSKDEGASYKNLALSSDIPGVVTSSTNGLVASGSGQANKVWKTDASGNPGWRDDSDTVTTIEDSLTSSSTTAALSAKQGKELKSQIDTKADTSYVDSNYVDISTNQTISGTKTFINAVKGVFGFVVEGTQQATTQTTKYNIGQISYSRATNGQLDMAYNYTLPMKSGTFAMTSDLPTPGIFTKLGNKTNFSFDSGSYLVVANNGLVTVTGTDPLNVGSSAMKKYVGIFMVTIAEYGGGQSVCVNTEEVFSGEAAGATISGPRFTIYRLN